MAPVPATLVRSAVGSRSREEGGGPGSTAASVLEDGAADRRSPPSIRGPVVSGPIASATVASGTVGAGSIGSLVGTGSTGPVAEEASSFGAAQLGCGPCQYGIGSGPTPTRSALPPAVSGSWPFIGSGRWGTSRRPPSGVVRPIAGAPPEARATPSRGGGGCG